MTRKPAAQEKRDGNQTPHPLHRIRKRRPEDANSIWRTLWEKWFPNAED